MLTRKLSRPWRPGARPPGGRSSPGRVEEVGLVGEDGERRALLVTRLVTAVWSRIRGGRARGAGGGGSHPGPSHGQGFEQGGGMDGRVRIRGLGEPGKGR